MKRKWYLKVDDKGRVTICNELWALLLRHSGSKAKSHSGQRKAVKRTFQNLLRAAIDER